MARGSDKRSKLTGGTPPEGALEKTRRSDVQDRGVSSHNSTPGRRARPGAAASLGLSSVAPVRDDLGDGRVSGGSTEGSSTMYAVVADVHDDVLRDVMKDSRERGGRCGLGRQQRAWERDRR
jgi:hypothetical protein